MRNIVVYGASSSRIDARYVEAGVAVGREIALAGYGLICGGGCRGLMAAAIDGALAVGGEATGVLPEFMDERGWAHSGLTRKLVVPDMHSRKAWMLGHSEAAIALPGGIGTFEELMEAISWRKLELWDGPTVILNTLGYYDPIIEQLNRAGEQGFGLPPFLTATDPAEAVRLACGR